MENSGIRDTVLQALKKKKGFESMTAAEINGNHFAAADIAVQDSSGNIESFRIAVIKQNPQIRSEA